jgi:hypothetical protein
MSDDACDRGPPTIPAASRQLFIRFIGGKTVKV